MGKRILITDTDSDLLDLYQGFFSVNGFEASTAVGWLECLEKVQTFQPDILVTHLEIPWGEGHSRFSRFGEEDSCLSLPATFVIGDLPPQAMSQMTGLPVRCCFCKPFRLSSLLGEISHSLLQGGAVGIHREFSKNLGSRIRTTRLRLFGEHGAPMMAEALNIPLRNLLNYENGVSISASFMRKFIEITNTNLQWLMTGVGTPYQTNTLTPQSSVPE